MKITWKDGKKSFVKVEKRIINNFHDSQLKFHSKYFNPQNYFYLLAAAVCDTLEMHPMFCRRWRSDLQKRCGVKVLVISGSHCPVNACMTCLFSAVLITSWVLVKANRTKISLSIEKTKWKKEECCPCQFSKCRGKLHIINELLCYRKWLFQFWWVTIMASNTKF